MSSAYSCLVYIEDERVQHVLANNSKLNVYVQVCNLISDVYVDFGRALVVDLTSNYVVPSALVDRAKLNDPSGEQQAELLAFLDKFHMCFSG